MTDYIGEVVVKCWYWLGYLNEANIQPDVDKINQSKWAESPNTDRRY